MPNYIYPTGPIHTHKSVGDLWKPEMVFEDESDGDENRVGDSEGVGQILYEMLLNSERIQ